MDQTVAQTQYNNIKATALEHFKYAAGYYNIPLGLLLAIGSRETGLRNIMGDSGHGFGIMQVDIRSFPEWCESGAWKVVRNSILKGAAVFCQKQRAIEHLQGRALLIKGHNEEHQFICPTDLTADEKLQLSVAAYNCGEGWAMCGLAVHENPDYYTTQGNYSADVLDRRTIFEQIILGDKG